MSRPERTTLPRAATARAHVLTIEGAAALCATHLRRLSNDAACGREVPRLAAELQRAARVLEECVAALGGRP